jgi:hypothetical protein
MGGTRNDREKASDSMNNTTRKRLKDIEAAGGPSEESFLSVEFYNLSPEGEEIRIRDPHLMAYEHPKSAQRMRCAR